MQLILSDANRRIRPDGHEGNLVGNIFGAAGVDITKAEGLGVVPDEVEGSLIHIHCPHGSAWGLEREGQGDWPPTATDVEQVSTRWRRRRVREKHVCSGINPVGAEDAIRSSEFVAVAGQVHAEGTELASACRC